MERIPSQVAVLDQPEQPVGEKGVIASGATPLGGNCVSSSPARGAPTHRFRQRRHRSCLEQVEFVAGDRPLHVLRRAEVLLHAPRHPATSTACSAEMRLASDRRRIALAAHHPLLARRLARNQPLAQAPDSGDDHLLTVPGDGVGREGHARRRRPPP